MHTTYDRKLITCLKFTNHCSVQERGDVEDLVQTHRRVDAFVLFASAKKDTHLQTDGVWERDREKEMST